MPNKHIDNYTRERLKEFFYFLDMFEGNATGEYISEILIAKRITRCGGHFVKYEALTDKEVDDLIDCYMENH